MANRHYIRQIIRDKRQWHTPPDADTKAKGFLGWHSRGYLPHFDSPGTIQFITFRLDDAFPLARGREWEVLLSIEDDRQRQIQLEDYLDKGHGAYIESNPVKAGLVREPNDWQFSSACWKFEHGQTGAQASMPASSALETTPKIISPVLDVKELAGMDACAPMTLGIFAKTFVRPTIEEVFDAVAAHDLHCVQFNFTSAGLPSMPDALAPGICERIRQTAAERRIAIVTVSGTFNMIHPDMQQRRVGLRRLNTIASACAGLGTSVVTLCTGTRDPENMWRRHPQNDLPEAWRDLLASLNDALAIAERFGITLAVEPEAGNVMDSARKARRLLDEMESPRLKIIMDPANLFHAGDLPRMKEMLHEAFELLGDDIVLAHGKEINLDGQAGNLPLGAGALDWDHYLLLLRQARFAGPLIMHGFDERDAAASVKFLRTKMEASPNVI